MQNSLSIYIIPPLLSMLCGIFLAFLSIIRGRRTYENILFSIVCIWWSLLSPLFISHHFLDDIDQILALERSVHFFYVYLPAINLLFFQKYFKIERNSIIVGGFILSFLISLTTPTSYYICGLNHYHWGCIIQGSVAFQIFGLYCFFTTLYLFVCFYKSIRSEKNPIDKLKRKYIFLSFFIIAVLTLLNIPAINGIDLYPAGNFTFIPLSILAYGVLKYRLLEIKTVFHLTFLWLVLSSLVIVPNYMVFLLIKPHFEAVKPLYLFVFFIVWFLFNYGYVVKIQSVINKYFFRAKHDLNEIGIQFIKSISLLKSPDDLIRELSKVLKKAFSFDYLVFLKRIENSNVYSDMHNAKWVIEEDVTNWLVKHNRMIDRNMIESNPLFSSMKIKIIPLFAQQECHFLIPLVQKGELIALIFLPEKSNLRPITTEEIKFINDIKVTVTTPLLNAIMYQDITSLKDDLERQTMELTQKMVEKKLAEQKIRKLNEELEKRVTERTIQYRNANQELQKSLETLKIAKNHLVESEKMAALGGLVAGVAHEINTPLGVALMAASLLYDKTQLQNQLYRDRQTKRSEFEKYLKTAADASGIILNNLNSAAELVKSFKQVAVDQSSKNLRKFDLKKYLEELLISLSPRFQKTKHSVAVHCLESIEVNSYPGTLTQILTILIMNSLIHGFEGMEKGVISIDVWREENNIVLCYKDNGKGMAKETLQKIYDPFFTTKRSQGSTGLGLHILFNLVTQSLKGHVECTSKINEGVVCIIFFPIDLNVSQSVDSE